jgi:hypothetical protein
MENEYLFAKNFALCLVLFYKIMGQNPKFFWVKWGTKHTLRLCLVFHEMQNAKCQLLSNNQMQNAKIFMSVFSSIQNTKFFMG